MSRAIVPIAQLQNRIPTAGRLRFGQKSGPKGAPKAIDTWRFTSHDREAIDQVASIYGGAVEAWSDAPTPGQWQVTTTASELRIVLPPDPLGGSPIYEQWSGGGCQRRCDGVTCVVNQRTGPDEVEPVETPCICDAKGELECQVKTRLSVILPDIKFAGVWRLDSGSWNVAHEMPGMVELVQSLQQRGLTRGLLALEHRKSVSGGKTRRYIVPTLRVDGSMDQLASGEMQVSALGTVEQRPAIGPGVVDSDSLETLSAAGEYADVVEPTPTQRVAIYLADHGIPPAAMTDFLGSEHGVEKFAELPEWDQDALAEHLESGAMDHRLGLARPDAASVIGGGADA